MAPPSTDDDAARERLVRPLLNAAFAVTVPYLAWRAAIVLGSPGPTSVLVLVTEVLAASVFAARAWAAGPAPAVPLRVEGVPEPDVVAVVDARGGDDELLRTTLLALRRVEGLASIRVAGLATTDVRCRATADRLGAAVLDTPPDHVDPLAAALSTAPSVWVLLVRVGELPTPDAVAVAAPVCAAPDIGVVQLGLEEADPTTFEKDVDGRWTLTPFEQEVVRPSLAGRGSLPWYGDGPVLVRRAALHQVADDPIGDPWSTGVALLAAGQRITFVPETLARIPAPDGFGAALTRHRGHVAPGLRSAAGGALRGLGRHDRLTHVLAVVPVLGAVQRLLMVVIAALVLIGGREPMPVPGVALVLLAVGSYAGRWSGHLLLGRGRLRRLSLMRSELRSFGVDLTPFVRWTPDGARRVGAWSLVAAIVVLDLAMVTAAIDGWRGTSDLPAETMAGALVLTAVYAGVAMEVLLDAALRHQRRRNRRVRLGLIRCRVEECEGELVDLSTTGVGIRVADPTAAVPPVGTVTTLSFRIPDADGAWRTVTTLARVVHVDVDPAGPSRLGLEYDEPAAASLDPVVEFLTIDRRLVAAGRRRLVAAGGADSDWFVPGDW